MVYYYDWTKRKTSEQELQTGLTLFEYSYPALQGTMDGQIGLLAGLVNLSDMYPRASAAVSDFWSSILQAQVAVGAAGLAQDGRTSLVYPPLLDFDLQIFGPSQNLPNSLRHHRRN